MYDTFIYICLALIVIGTPLLWLFSVFSSVCPSIKYYTSNNKCIDYRKHPELIPEYVKQEDGTYK